MNIEQTLIDAYVKMFHQKGEEIIKPLCTCAVPKKVMLWKYQYVHKLEDLPDEEKVWLKKYVWDMFPGSDPEFRLDACKIIFTLNQSIEE